MEERKNLSYRLAHLQTVLVCCNIFYFIPFIGGNSASLGSSSLSMTSRPCGQKRYYSRFHQVKQELKHLDAVVLPQVVRCDLTGLW